MVCCFTCEFHKMKCQRKQDDWWLLRSAHWKNKFTVRFLPAEHCINILRNTDRSKPLMKLEKQSEIMFCHNLICSQLLWKFGAFLVLNAQFSKPPLLQVLESHSEHSEQLPSFLETKAKRVGAANATKGPTCPPKVGTNSRRSRIPWASQIC